MPKYSLPVIKGLVGSALLQNLKEKGYRNFVLKTSKQLDLTNQEAVASFFRKEKPEYVFLSAAKVGGIVANNIYRAEFIYDNLMIQNNVIHQSYLHGVKKLLFLGSTCIYPKNSAQPMKEEFMLTDTLEYTNEPYAIAKIAGIKMCESYNLQYGTNFIAVQPTNLYGPNDNFDLEKSHVLPALFRKIYLAKAVEENDWDAIRRDLNKLPIENVDGKATEVEILSILSKYGIRLNEPLQSNKELPSTIKSVAVEIWGTGKPMREFLWSEDMAEACVFLMENINFPDLIKDKNEVRNTHINIGSGNEISIKDLAFKIKSLIGFRGDFYFNSEKPDGTMRKLTDVTKLNNLGWELMTPLDEGLKRYLSYFIS